MRCTPAPEVRSSRPRSGNCCCRLSPPGPATWEHGPSAAILRVSTRWRWSGRQRLRYRARCRRRRCHGCARTLNRYLKMPEFQLAYLEARRAAMFQAHARLQQASSAAVSALLKVMVDPSTPASTRVRAADCILARGNQGLENEDLDVRLAALERVAELAKAPGPY